MEPTTTPTVVFTCECCEADGSAPERAVYVVTSHEGEKVHVSYCSDCAELAAMDWNGETAAIERVVA